MFGLVWATTAGAWELVQSLELPALLDPPVDAVLSQDADGARLVVARVGETTVHALDGTLLGSLPLRATALTAWDADGDGVTELYACTEGGLVAAADGTVLDPGACEVVVAHAVGGVPGLAVADHEVRLLFLTSTGWSAPLVVGSPVGGPPFLAAREELLATSSWGRRSYDLIGAGGTSTHDAGGTVSGLAASPRGFWLSLQDPGALRDTAGAVVAVSPEPGALASGDFDGDGILDVLVTWPGGRWMDIVPGSGVATRRIGLGVAPVAAPRVEDADADGCDDVVLIDEARTLVRLYTVADCGLDLDDDGITASDGDCNDLDPGRHPDHEEVCDGDDDDCDAEIDELGELRIAGPESLLEGEAVLLSVETKGCTEGLRLEWSATTLGIATCEPVGTALGCVAADDGDLAFEARMVDGSGVERAVDVHVARVENVAPVFVDEGGEPLRAQPINLEIGDLYRRAFLAADPGDDVLTFSTSGGPPGWSITDDGEVHYKAFLEHVGRHDARITVTDDDGARTELLLSVQVLPQPDTGRTTCSAESCFPSVVLPPALLLALRRRRLRAGSPGTGSAR